MFRFKNILYIACVIFLVACKPAMQKRTTDKVVNAQKPDTSNECSEIKGDRKVKLDLIQQLMDKGKLFAALAHLDALRSQSPQARYFRAEILRRTQRSRQAEPLYRELTRGCMAGKGYHGLGLIAGKRDNVAVALGFFQKAAHELPLDVRVRNDFGYALLLNGQYVQARNEFMTALELSGGDELIVTNLALLLILTGTEAEVQGFASQMSLDDEAMQQLRQQADQIKASKTATIEP